MLFHRQLHVESSRRWELPYPEGLTSPPTRQMPQRPNDMHHGWTPLIVQTVRYADRSSPPNVRFGPERGFVPKNPP